jgi:hypothetical protein
MRAFEKWDCFLSHRQATGGSIARIHYGELILHASRIVVGPKHRNNLKIFFDMKTIGNETHSLEDAIKNCSNFIVILTVGITESSYPL